MRKNRTLRILAAALLLAAMVAPAVKAQAQAPERYLHVRVIEEGEKGESVRVNVPLALAEAVLPAIKVHQLENGKLRVHHHEMEDVDLRAIVQAVRDAKDGEFVTVQGKRENLRVAKQAGSLIVQVREGKEETNRVDVKVPMTVVEALLSGGKNELDLLAALRALSKHGDAELVTVRDKNTTVRIWVDSKSTAE